MAFECRRQTRTRIDADQNILDDVLQLRMLRGVSQILQAVGDWNTGGEGRFNF